MKDQLAEVLDQLPVKTIAKLLVACARSLDEGDDLQTYIKDMDFHGKQVILDQVFLNPEIARCARECTIRLGANEGETPFVLGDYARETWELFEAGWFHADKYVKERQEQARRQKDTQGCVRLLETALYDSASRGDATDKVKALNYFKARLEPKESPLLGEHILSCFTALCAISLICLGGMFLAKASCYGNGSNFCGDINAAVIDVTSYFTDYRK